MRYMIQVSYATKMEGILKEGNEFETLMEIGLYRE